MGSFTVLMVSCDNEDAPSKKSATNCVGGQLIRELSVENLMVRVICDSFKEGTAKVI